MKKTFVSGTMALAVIGLTVPMAAQSEEGKPANASVDPLKKSRKKKVQMCSECGKPESECECEDNRDKKHGAQEEGHEEADGHKH